MTDNAKNSLENGGTVRLPGWVIEELETIISKSPRGSRPTRGDLLAEAWKAYQLTRSELGRALPVEVPGLRTEELELLNRIRELRADKSAIAKRLLKVVESSLGIEHARNEGESK